MEYSVKLEEVASRPLAVLRRRVGLQELSKVIPECCGLVWNQIRALKISGAGRHVAVYRDNKINLDVGVELEAPFAGHDDLLGSSTPAGTVASTVHLGPYHTLSKAHEAIKRWCAAQHCALAGPCWEIYGHWKQEWDSDPSQIRTDVYYLIANGTGAESGKGRFS